MDNYVNNFIEHNKFEISNNCKKICFKKNEKKQNSEICLKNCFTKYENTFLFFTQKLLFNQKNFKHE